MYRNCSDMQNETEEIKHIDLIQVAESMGYTFHKKGRTYECNEEKGLVYFPNTNSYYHFYNNEGGSVIDFVMRYQGLGFPDAVNNLKAYLTGASYSFSPKDTETNKEISKSSSMLEPDKGILNLPDANDNYKRAFAYLTKSRGISPGIISRLMHEKRIYEEKKHHNVVFIGTDATGTPKHAFIRGTITEKQFRGDVKNSDKDYGFNIKGSNNILIVFEAPIDLLSYMTIFPETRCHLLALGMLSSAPILRYTDEHPEIKSISFLLDEDAPGRDAALSYKKEFADKGFNIVNTTISEKLEASGCKDVNEYLTYLKSQLPKEDINKNNELVKELTKEPEVKKRVRTIR